MSGPPHGNRDQWYYDTTGHGQPDYDPNADPTEEIQYSHNMTQPMMDDLGYEGGYGYKGQEYGEAGLGALQGAADGGAAGIPSAVGDPIGGLAHMAPAAGKSAGMGYLDHTLSHTRNARPAHTGPATGLESYTDPHTPGQISSMYGSGAYHPTPPQYGAGSNPASASTHSYNPQTQQLTIPGHGPVAAPPSQDHPGYNTFVHPKTNKVMYFRPGNPNKLIKRRAMR